MNYEKLGKSLGRLALNLMLLSFLFFIVATIWIEIIGSVIVLRNENRSTFNLLVEAFIQFWYIYAFILIFILISLQFFILILLYGKYGNRSAGLDGAKV